MGEVGIGELRACDQQGAVGDLICREGDLPGAERRDRYERSPQGPEPESREPSRSAGECPRSSDIEEKHGLMIPISPPPGVSSRDCEYDSAPRFAGRRAGVEDSARIERRFHNLAERTRLSDAGRMGAA